MESRFPGDHTNQLYGVAQQLLTDSLRFVHEILDFMEELYSACNESFSAPSEAWELVCHCLDELFSKELKPSLCYCVSQDLVDE